jgi:hypothetical protein
VKDDALNKPSCSNVKDDALNKPSCSNVKDDTLNKPSCSNVKDDTLNKPSCSNVKDDIKSREIQEVPKDPKNKTDELVKEDFLSLVNDMENMSATLKKINRNLAGRNNTEVFAMLEKFDRFLHSIKVIIHVI